MHPSPNRDPAKLDGSDFYRVGPTGKSIIEFGHDQKAMIQCIITYDIIMFSVGPTDNGSKVGLKI